MISHNAESKLWYFIVSISSNIKENQSFKIKANFGSCYLHSEIQDKNIRLVFYLTLLRQAIPGVEFLLFKKQSGK